MASTSMNSASSRSHCIFNVEITARPLGEPLDASIIDQYATSMLTLVDLAGSERMNQVGPLLDQFKITLLCPYLGNIRN